MKMKPSNHGGGGRSVSLSNGNTSNHHHHTNGNGNGSSDQIGHHTIPHNSCFLVNGKERKLSNSYLRFQRRYSKHGTKDAVFDPKDGSVQMHLRGKPIQFFAPSNLKKSYSLLSRANIQNWPSCQISNLNGSMVIEAKMPGPTCTCCLQGSSSISLRLWSFYSILN